MSECNQNCIFQNNEECWFACKEKIRKEVVKDFGHWLSENGYDSSCHTIDLWIKTYLELKEKE